MATTGAKKSRSTQNKRKTIKKSSKNITRKAKSKARQLIKIGSVSDLKLPVEDIKAQLISYGDQIQKYLGDVNAKVDAFNFGVEKSDNGLTIACEVKAVIGS
jgi:hypothetical protein